MTNPVLHVTGARPNFPKAAPVIRALEHLGIAQEIVHTGQHYDRQLSDVFFAQLGLPAPDHNLGVGSGSHAAQTAAAMTGLERLLTARSYQMIIVYGDVNSTLAAALVAAKLRVPLAHVEAGLRSFDMTMPEEVNRLVTDRLSDLLFATSPEAVAHLGREGVDAERIFLVGNPMIDTLLRHVPQLDSDAARARLGLSEHYVLITLHRPANVDHPAEVIGLVKAVHAVADAASVVLPVHPRSRHNLAQAGMFDHPRVVVTEPLGYVEFLSLLNGAAAVATDSGGVQEESTILGVPCLTLRPNTERPITITDGTNRLVAPESLPDAVGQCLASGRPTRWATPPLWDGQAGPRIARVIADRVAA